MGCSGSKGAADGGEYTEHVLRSRWELGKDLGKGAYGRVVLATNKKTSGKVAAIKIMTKATMKAEDIDNVKSEVDIMRKLQHRNIVHFLDFFDEHGEMYVVLEYLSGGELFQRLQKKEVYSERDARDLVYILLSAVKHMHDLHIVHRDLKPENLLMASSNDADVKIADFGFAAYAPEPTLTETCGTPAYVAPEVLSGQPYGKAADMWSLGVITYILLGGYAPFDGDDVKQLFRHIKECRYSFHDEYWSDVSNGGKDFIRKLLVLDPTARLTVDQALDHSWVKQAAGDLVVKNLTKAMEGFKTFNGERKLRGAVKAVMATNRLRRFSANAASIKADEAALFHDSSDVKLDLDAEDDDDDNDNQETGAGSGAGSAAAAAAGAYTEHKFASRWVMGKKLGEGAFAEVKLCTSIKDPSRQCAVKILTKAKMNASDLESVKSEVAIMRRLQHPNIVQFLDFFEEEKVLYIVIEYLSGGELFDRIVDKTHYSEKEARDVVFLFLSALKHCHDHNIVHRDLKPENLLLATKEDDELIKIADFGLSAEDQDGRLTDVCGSPSYMAPEILLHKHYGKPVDLWAVGVISYILLGGYPPFDQADEKAVKHADFAFHDEYWGHVSGAAKEFIRGLLVLEPAKRLTVDTALAHPWIKTAASDLAGRNLSKSLAKFKEFHAKRKLKATVKGVIMTGRLKKLTSTQI